MFIGSELEVDKVLMADMKAVGLIDFSKDVVLRTIQGLHLVIGVGLGYSCLKPLQGRFTHSILYNLAHILLLARVIGYQHARCSTDELPVGLFLAQLEESKVQYVLDDSAYLGEDQGRH